MTVHSLALAALLALCLAPSWAHAKAVALAGMLGSKALLVVDANPPKAVGAGEEFQGVKVIAVTKEEATVEIGGARRTLRLGEAPVSVGARSGRSRRRPSGTSAMTVAALATPRGLNLPICGFWASPQ